MMFGTPLAAASSIAGFIEAEQPLVILLAIERDRDRAARTAGIHRRDEAILLQRRPVGGTDQIEALDAEPRGLAAAVFDAVSAREHAARDALLDAPFAGGGGGVDWPADRSLSRRTRSRSGHQRCGHGTEKLSASHRNTSLV